MFGLFQIINHEFKENPQKYFCAESYEPPPARYKISSYLHGALSREQCHEILLRSEHNLSQRNSVISMSGSSRLLPNTADSPDLSDAMRRVSVVSSGTDDLLDPARGVRSPSLVTSDDNNESCARAALNRSIPCVPGDDVGPKAAAATSQTTVFLVRSSTRIGSHVLSLRHAGQTLHFEILEPVSQSSMFLTPVSG